MPPMPPGDWTILDTDAVLIESDLWYNHEDYAGGWRNDGFNPGVTVEDYGNNFTWIRQVKPPQQPDKEWLNPWD